MASTNCDLHDATIQCDGMSRERLDISNRAAGAANGVVVVSLRCHGQATMATSIHPITSPVESVRQMNLRRPQNGFVSMAHK